MKTTPEHIQKAFANFQKAANKTYSHFKYYSDNIIEPYEPLKKTLVGNYISVIFQLNEHKKLQFEHCGHVRYYLYASVKTPHMLNIQSYAKNRGDEESLFITGFELETLKNGIPTSDNYYVLRDYYDKNDIIELGDSKLKTFIHSIERLSMQDRHKDIDNTFNKLNTAL